MVDDVIDYAIVGVRYCVIVICGAIAAVIAIYVIIEDVIVISDVKMSVRGSVVDGVSDGVLVIAYVRRIYSGIVDCWCSCYLWSDSV